MVVFTALACLGETRNDGTVDTERSGWDHEGWGDNVEDNKHKKLKCNKVKNLN
jgi:hypothetical protein